MPASQPSQAIRQGFFVTAIPNTEQNNMTTYTVTAPT